MKIRLFLTVAGGLLPAFAGAQEFDCMIEARQTVEIRSSVEAVIETVKVQRGSLVSRGQVLVTLESGPERAAPVLALRTIRSPVTGVVVEVMRKPGEFGAISFKDPIMKLAEIDPLHVEAILPASMYGKVRRGQRAVVMPEAPIGGRYETTVTIVDPVIDASSGTLGVRLELPNRKGNIPAGARCRLQFL
jgi:multidrug efflux pump subunit AcrA (membrane-fusion protein)